MRIQYFFQKHIFRAIFFRKLLLCHQQHHDTSTIDMFKHLETIIIFLIYPIYTTLDFNWNKENIFYLNGKDYLNYFPSIGAILDLIRIVHKNGGFHRVDPFWLLERITDVASSRPDNAWRALEDVVINGARAHYTSIHGIESLGLARDNTIQYPQLANFTIRITENFFEANRFLAPFNRQRTLPIFFDTESAHFPVRHRDRLALLTFCDIDTQTIVLWRIHKTNEPELRRIHHFIAQLGQTRTFAVFGMETLLPPDRVLNLQPRSMPSLKQLALEVTGIILNKEESLSDWVREVLRIDQIHYACMDAVILHHIYDENINCSCSFFQSETH
eukprot:NP_493360.1 Uncharacterized protein CELE_W05H12.2 [Caenorhabditis elegans]